MTSGWNDREARAIQVYRGEPHDPSASKEPSRWSRFLAWFLPGLRKKVQLADELASNYARAKVGQEEAEAEKRKAEAQRAAAEAAETAARADAARMQEVKQFCDIVDGVDFSSPGPADALKLARLLQENPEVAEQLNTVASLFDRLRLMHGTEVQVVVGDLPEVTAQVAKMDALHVHSDVGAPSGATEPPIRKLPASAEAENPPTDAEEEPVES